MHCFHGLIQASRMGRLYRYMGCASCTSAAGVRETRRHKLCFPIVRDGVNSPQHPAPERYELRMRFEDNMGDSSPQLLRCLKKH